MEHRKMNQYVYRKNQFDNHIIDIIRTSDNAVILEKNLDDWSDYLIWLSEGNMIEMEAPALLDLEPTIPPVEPEPIPEPEPEEIILYRYIERRDTDALLRLPDNKIIGPENTKEWKKYQDWLADGNSIEPPIEDPIPVPASVSPLQMRRALRTLGLKDSVDWLVSTLDQEGQESWEYAIEIQRNDTLIRGAAAALGKTEEDIDNLFRLAATYI
jgi:hypothetical protein